MNIPLIFTLLFMLVAWCIVIPVTEVRSANRKAPDGKIFKRDFVRSLDWIRSTCNNAEFVTKVVNDVEFKVKVVEEYNIPCIESDYRNAYSCIVAYIDDEEVCREHILQPSYLYDSIIKIEFTNKRPRDEIIRILTETGDKCMQMKREAEAVAPKKSNSYFD